MDKIRVTMCHETGRITFHGVRPTLYLGTSLCQTAVLTEMLK